MPYASANVNTANMELGPMRVTFKRSTDVTAIDVGGIKGLEVTTTYKTTPISADQFGSEPIDMAVSGMTFTVKMDLAEVRNKANWLIAFPHADLITDGTDVTKKNVDFRNKVGEFLSDHAGVLTLHPLNKADSDKSADYTFPKAVAKSASSMKYGPDAQTVLSVEFVILPDTGVSPARYMQYGDITATP